MSGDGKLMTLEELEAFVQKMQDDGILGADLRDPQHDKIEKRIFKVIQEAVEAECEACAEVCDSMEVMSKSATWSVWHQARADGLSCAASGIRNRRSNRKTKLDAA